LTAAQCRIGALSSDSVRQFAGASSIAAHLRSM
jgi:hypothetical protein